MWKRILNSLKRLMMINKPMSLSKLLSLKMWKNLKRRIQSPTSPMTMKMKSLINLMTMKTMKMKSPISPMTMRMITKKSKKVRISTATTYQK